MSKFAEKVEEEEEEEDEELQDAYRIWDELWADRVEVLIEKLNEKSGHLLLIVEVLGEVCDSRAERPLLNLLPCDDEVLQEATIEALIALGVSESMIEQRLQRNGIVDDCARSPSSKPTKTAKTGKAVLTPSQIKPLPFTLNMESVQHKIAETTKVQELLQTHFQEEDAPASPVRSSVVPAVVASGSASALPATAANPFHVLDNSRFVLLNMLLQKPVWKLAEIAIVAAPLGLMASAALEQFNDMAYEACDEPIFEGDDPVEVNIALAKELLA